MRPQVSLVRVGPDGLDRLEPLWSLLLAHHRSVAPKLAPFTDGKTSWRLRRTQYRGILAEGGGVWLAQRGGTDVGYAVYARRQAFRPATFAAQRDICELATLVVHPACRGRAIGSRLLAAVDETTSTAGHPTRLVGLLPDNTAALRFYAAHGFRPAWVTLTRFQRPPPPLAPEPADSVDIQVVTPGEVEGLRELWLALHRHHQAVAADLGPFVGDGDSWASLRRVFLGAACDGVLLRAGSAAAPLALACATVAAADPGVRDTWVTGPRVAEIKVLIVAESARNRRIGSRLLEMLDARLAAIGIEDVMVAAIAPNDGALRLYRRHGFRPAWLELMRLPPRA